MPRWRDGDALLGVAPAGNAQIQPGARQRNIGMIEPGVPQSPVVFLTAGEACVDDATVGGATRSAVGLEHGDGLFAEAVDGQRPHRVHEVDVWVARLVVVDPVDRKAPARELLHVALHQLDVLPP